MIITNMICSLLSYLGILLCSQNIFLSQELHFPELVICVMFYGLSFAITSCFFKKISKKDLTLNIIILFIFKLLILLLALCFEDSVFSFIELFADTITIYLIELLSSLLDISQLFIGLLALILSVVYCSGILLIVNKLFFKTRENTGE